MGPHQNGSKFWNVAQEQGFLHCKVTTAWAEANGDIESLLQMLKKGPKTASIDLKGNPFDRKLKKTIGNYHAMPHPVTKQTLDQLPLERDLCRKLPERRFRVTRSRGEMRQRKNWWKSMQTKGEMLKNDRLSLVTQSFWNRTELISPILKSSKKEGEGSYAGVNVTQLWGWKGLWSWLKGERSKPGTHHNTKYLSMQGRSSMTCWTWTKTALVTPKQRRELR